MSNDEAIISEDVMKTLRGIFWDGFDSFLILAINLLDNYESDELATMNCLELIEQIKQDLHEEAELYKQGG
ncbi:MAG TPA: hypothetical protein VK553_10480 [Candidatus Nitrosopolaris rasttigaisensis]|nr:hypothetical protein [Candidatus Nitrosopolaris rasttigaisensis]